VAWSPSGRSSASARECAGSVEVTSTRCPRDAARTAVAAATEVLPTPPLPVNSSTRVRAAPPLARRVPGRPRLADLGLPPPSTPSTVDGRSRAGQRRPPSTTARGQRRRRRATPGSVGRAAPAGHRRRPGGRRRGSRPTGWRPRARGPRRAGHGARRSPRTAATPGSSHSSHSTARARPVPVRPTRRWPAPGSSSEAPTATAGATARGRAGRHVPAEALARGRTGRTRRRGQRGPAVAAAAPPLDAPSTTRTSRALALVPAAERRSRPDGAALPGSVRAVRDVRRWGVVREGGVALGAPRRALRVAGSAPLAPHGGAHGSRPAIVRASRWRRSLHPHSPARTTRR
jgi:hypothetical protein